MTSESQRAPLDPGSGEPTVLDYYKSVTKDWRSFFNFVRSVRDSERRIEIQRALVLEAHVQDDLEPAPEPTRVRAFPWRSALGLVLALSAQYLLEPPAPNAELAVGLFFFAAGLVVWAFVRDEWRLTPLRRELPQNDALKVRSIPLFLAIIFSLAAFFLFTDNLFTILNVSLWLIGIAFFVWAAWLPRPPRAATARGAEHVAVRRRQLLWLAALTAVFGLMIFIRMNRIDAIPAEPFSDHAEKILDVYDITQGDTHIFFVRNSGREAFQMYWTLLVSWIFGTGLSFLSLKLGTALLGLLTLPYIYLLGKELGGARAGLLALFLFGMAYWQNVIARIGLRFPLYPLFAAPVLYYLLRGLRTRNRNDFVLCGLFLGVGLHGYSPIRIMPFIVLVAVGLYLLYKRDGGERRQAVWWLVLVGVAALLVFLPLLRYALEDPTNFSYRAFSRLSDVEQPLPGPAWQIFFSNLWNALLMFNWKDGQIWVNSVPNRPALDVVTAALFLIGVVLLIGRFIRGRDWRDLFLLLSIPLLLMPSVLSLAYPDENPALNRAGAAAVPAILIAALALDGLLTALTGPAEGSQRLRAGLAWGITGILLVAATFQNYDLVFRQFDEQYRGGAWNTSEMGKVISAFRDDYGQTDTVWIVPFPFWVDTRLPGVWAGIPNRDFAMFPENLPGTFSAPYPKLFIYWPEDTEAARILNDLYPNGVLSRYESVNRSRDFFLYFVEQP